MKNLIKIIFVLSFLFSLSGYAGERQEDDFWQRTKKAAKRAAKGIKEGGKEVGRATQEVFDSNDEDLVAERKGKKKVKKADSD